MKTATQQMKNKRRFLRNISHFIFWNKTLSPPIKIHERQCIKPSTSPVHQSIQPHSQQKKKRTTRPWKLCIINSLALTSFLDDQLTLAKPLLQTKADTWESKVEEKGGFLDTEGVSPTQWNLVSSKKIVCSFL